MCLPNYFVRVLFCHLQNLVGGFDSFLPASSVGLSPFFFPLCYDCQNGLLCLSLFFPWYKISPLSPHFCITHSVEWPLCSWSLVNGGNNFSLRICTFMSSYLKDFGVLYFGHLFLSCFENFPQTHLAFVSFAFLCTSLGREWISIVPKGNCMLISEALYIFVTRV